MSYQMIIEKQTPQFRLFQKFTMGTSEFVFILFKEKEVAKHNKGKGILKCFL